MTGRKRISASVYVDRENEDRILSGESGMNEVLIKNGIRISCSPSRYQDRKGLKRYAVMIEFDGRTLGRGAGRKPLECRVGMDDALRMEKQGTDKKKIAEQMGVSLATYYRRRKNYLEGSCQGN